MYMINEKSSGYNENEKNTLLKCSWPPFDGYLLNPEENHGFE
jgi:hypothetical protein